MVNTEYEKDMADLAEWKLLYKQFQKEMRLQKPQGFSEEDWDLYLNEYTTKLPNKYKNIEIEKIKSKQHKREAGQKRKNCKLKKPREILQEDWDLYLNEYTAILPIKYRCIEMNNSTIQF